jgi:hypothetical protein
MASTFGTSITIGTPYGGFGNAYPFEANGTGTLNFK